MLVFWISVSLVGYTYVAYPLLVWAASKCTRNRRLSARPRTAQARPTVSVCIACRNEAPRLQHKLTSLNAQDYPRDLIEIIIASDGSTDGTVAVARALPGVAVLDCTARGKAAALNAAVAAARGEILVFTDARQRLDARALTALIDRLGDPDIGVVSGELILEAPATGVAASIGLYWRYEKFIRRAESEYFSAVGATGALYAMRRSEFKPLRPGTLLDDFEIPMAVLRTGRRIVFEERARIYDVAESSLAAERRRKIRTLAGNWQSLAANRWLIVPGKNPALWQYISHKLCRLIVPFALLGMLAAAWLTGGAFYRMAAAAQTAFWCVALLGSCLPVLRRLRLIGMASLLLELNWAAVAGLVYYCRGMAESLWRSPAAANPSRDA